MHNQPSLLAELDTSCQRIVALVSSLSDAQLNVPLHPGINPPVWELGHAAFFFERFLFQPLDGAASINPALDEIWDSFELVHEDRWQPGLFPDRHDTLAYFNEIHHRLRQRILSKPLTDNDLYLYRYGIHHLHMHTESMTWCRQTLAYPPPPWAGQSASEPSHATERDSNDIHIPAGRYRIGMPSQSPQFAREHFCFDNEKPGFDTDVDSFSISQTLVSNGQFLDFVNAGGYDNPALWSRAGQRWLKQTGQKHPLYWKQTPDGWMERVFDQWIPLQHDRPVRHVNYREAMAWCAFAGRRLPTEIEWEVAALANKAGTETTRVLPWHAGHAGYADMDCAHMALQAVTAFEQGDSPFACRQMMGTLWEWTSTTFLPYDGFSVDMYPLMSTLQFGTHKVTRGGSFASAASLLRGTYRQAYCPERNDVFTGFRTCAV